MILTYININPELLINLVVSNLKMWAEAHPQDTCQPQGNPLTPYGRAESEAPNDQMSGMSPRKPHNHCTTNGREPWAPGLTLIGNVGELKHLIFEQQLNNKGCSRIQFFLSIKKFP